MITTYTYSNANRLLSENAGGQITSYTNDAAGNRTQVDAPSGNTYYEWDAASRMVNAEPPAGPVTFTYNADGQRVAKEGTDGVTGFLYDHKRLLHETDDLGDVENTYVNATQDEYGDLLNEYGEESERFHQFDAQASTNALVDPECDVQGRFKYDAFGSVHAFGQEGIGWASLTVDQWAAMTTDEWAALPVEGSATSGSLRTMGFGSQKNYYADLETELYLLGGGGGGRYYDSKTGRFLSEDQVPTTPNLYPYAENDPVNKVDPSGKQVGLQGDLTDRERQLYLEFCERFNAALDQGALTAVYVAEFLDGGSGKWATELWERGVTHDEFENILFALSMEFANVPEWVDNRLPKAAAEPSGMTVEAWVEDWERRYQAAVEVHLGLLTGASVGLLTVGAGLAGIVGVGIFAGPGAAIGLGGGVAGLGIGSSAGERRGAGQSVGQTIGGTAADLSGVGSIYTGLTDRDIATGEFLLLSEYERAYQLGEGAAFGMSSITGLLHVRPRVSIRVRSANPTARYLEYKALRAQGLNASEAYGLMRQFDAGVVSPDQFLFHFTTIRGGRGITTEGVLYASRSGFAGPGVYVGTTSTPNWLTKHVPFIGWGLGPTPVRVPVIVTLELAPAVRHPWLPVLRTRVIGKGADVRLGD